MLDEACNSICHVFMGGPFLSTVGLCSFISRSLTAFCRQIDHFTHKDLSRMFTLFIKTKKKGEKKIRNPIKNTAS